VFDSAPLAEPIEVLGAPVITLGVFADRPLANLIVRLCDVHPDGASLRVSYGVLNLAHRDGHEAPMPLVPGRRYQVRLRLNDAGSALPAGHVMRVAISTAYWPMVWPSPERATVTIVEGALEIPVRARCTADWCPAFGSPESAAPERTTEVRPGVTRIDRLGIELGTQSSSQAYLNEDDPLSASVEMRQSQTIARGDWRVRIDTFVRMSCTQDAFLLHASVLASEDAVEVCRRDWSRQVPRHYS
jgi:hypothetical protein